MIVKLLVEPTSKQKRTAPYNNMKVGDTFNTVDAPIEIRMIRFPHGGVWIEAEGQPIFLFAGEWQFVSN